MIINLNSSSLSASKGQHLLCDKKCTHIELWNRRAGNTEFVKDNFVWKKKTNQISTHFDNRKKKRVFFSRQYNNYKINHYYLCSNAFKVSPSVYFILVSKCSMCSCLSWTSPVSLSWYVPLTQLEVDFPQHPAQYIQNKLFLNPQKYTN